MEVSKSSLLEPSEKTVKVDVISAIFQIIREMSVRSDGGMCHELVMSDVKERVITKGFSEEDLSKCLEEYERDDVWMITKNGATLRWLRIASDDGSE